MSKLEADAKTPEQAARLLGVSTQTLRTWDREGRIRSLHTPNGHRRYFIDPPQQPPAVRTKQSVLYARVSSRKQLGDLARQVEALRSIHPTYRVVTDVGSGLNFKRKGLLRILDLAFEGRLGEVVVAYKDRLARFGFDLVEHVLKRHGAVVTVLHNPAAVPGSTSELADDLMAIVTVFAARHHGSRRSGHGHGTFTTVEDGEEVQGDL